MSLMFMDEDESRKAGLPLGLTPLSPSQVNTSQV